MKMTVRYFKYIGFILTMIVLSGCSGGDNDRTVKPETPRETEVQDTFYLAVDEMPQIIGGIQTIQKHIRYPKSAHEAGIEGTVYVYAFIDTSGNVARTEIVRDPGGGLGEAAAEAVEQAKFVPGKQQGEPVPVRVSIPVHFRLARPEVTEEDVSIRFIEGPQNLRQYMSFPEDVFKEEIEGTVHVEVRLNENARVIGILLVEGIDHELDQAVIQAAARYPFYRDGNYNTITEPTTFSIRVQFSF